MTRRYPAYGFKVPFDRWHPVRRSTCASMEHRPAPHPAEETLSAGSGNLENASEWVFRSIYDHR